MNVKLQSFSTEKGIGKEWQSYLSKQVKLIQHKDNSFMR